MRLSVLFLLVLGSVLFRPQFAHACSCGNSGTFFETLAKELRQVATSGPVSIVRGTVREVYPGTSEKWLQVKLDMNETLFGSSELKTIQLTSGPSSACVASLKPFELNTEWILIVPPKRDETYQFSNCGIHFLPVKTLAGVKFVEGPFDSRGPSLEPLSSVKTKLTNVRQHAGVVHKNWKALKSRLNVECHLSSAGLVAFKPIQKKLTENESEFFFSTRSTTPFPSPEGKQANSELYERLQNLEDSLKKSVESRFKIEGHLFYSFFDLFQVRNWTARFTVLDQLTGQKSSVELSGMIEEGLHEGISDSGTQAKFEQEFELQPGLNVPLSLRLGCSDFLKPAKK